MINIELFNDLLTSANIIPIEENWNSFKIVHPTVKPDKLSENAQIESIKKEVQNKKGLYCYFNSEGQCLYVGKGNTLLSRLKSHYRESFIPDYGSSRTWNLFFEKNAGELTVYWLEIDAEDSKDSEDLRVIIERLITRKLKPIFVK